MVSCTRSVRADLQPVVGHVVEQLALNVFALRQWTAATDSLRPFLFAKRILGFRNGSYRSYRSYRSPSLAIARLVAQMVENALRQIA
jgi:hypothetical protein